MELGTVRQIDIDQEMQTAYLDYAMSVIVARALPDVRDGLKPVQRRILYAMHDMGLRPDRPYKKSARIVGEVLGKYHPHGDSAVYEAMARMAQDFSLRYPLVDGQGNFGSIDGDNPAAMRYTEARLARIADEMVADIDKATVDFGPNFDGTLTEPSVLPAILPNLLVNGAAGIAVGMTTNVPPHNLGEVCDALAYLIDNYSRLDDVGVEDLARFIQGPDFPTGGIVYRYAGESDEGDRNDVIVNAYAMGRGQLTVQARAHIEDMSRNRSRIVITELPYQVNKTRLIERIAELVRDGRLEGITDLRDESDRQGMRLTVEMTRTVEPRTILSQLFKLTPMQVTFGMMMVALVDGEPRLLPLKKILTYYLDHRQQVITRRSQFLLERAKHRAHILEGLLIALDHIDEVIALIRRSRTADTARAGLMKEFKLTEIQAQAILDMPLKRLAALERRLIADEHKQKLDEIKYLQGLLRSPAKIRGVIRDELMALKEKYGDVRRTQIVDREKGYHTAHDLVEAEDVIVTLWQSGEVGRSPLPPHPLPARALPLARQQASSRDDVAFFSAGGQAVLVPIHQVPDDRTQPVSGLSSLDRAETPIGALVLARPQADEEGPAGYVTLATRGGRIKRVTLQDLAAAASRGAVSAINIEPGDRLGWVALTSGQDEVLLVTRQGKAIRFAEEEVRAMGLSAAGVLAVKLAADDAVVGMGIYRDKAVVVTITDQGLAKRMSAADFPTQKRYGGGVQAAKVSGHTGLLAAAALAYEGQQLGLLTAQGEVIILPIRAIASMGRATTGQKKRSDTKTSIVEPAAQGAPTLLVALDLLLPAGPEAGDSRPGRGTAGDEGAPAAPAPRRSRTLAEPAPEPPAAAPRGRAKTAKTTEPPATAPRGRAKTAEIIEQPALPTLGRATRTVKTTDQAAEPPAASTRSRATRTTKAFDQAVEPPAAKGGRTKTAKAAEPPAAAPKGRAKTTKATEPPATKGRAKTTKATEPPAAKGGRTSKTAKTTEPPAAKGGRASKTAKTTNPPAAKGGRASKTAKTTKPPAAKDSRASKTGKGSAAGTKTKRSTTKKRSSG